MSKHSSPAHTSNKALAGVLALLLALAIPVAPAQAHDDHDHEPPADRPDLVIQHLTLSAIPQPGETVVVSVGVANVGPGDLLYEYAPVVVRSEDHSLYFWDYVYELPSGANVTFTTNWTAPEYFHVLTAAVDRWDYVNETNETNNEATLDVTVGDPLPDLVGWGPLLVPQSVLYGDQDDDQAWRSTIREGDAMTLYARFYNQGTAPAEALRVRSFLNGTLYDEQVLDSQWGFGSFLYLANWTATVGTHTFRVVADPLGEITEKNETNNEIELTFTVLTVDEPVPDLAVVSVDLPEDAAVGDHIEVTAIIENTGTVAAPPVDSYLRVNNLGQAKMRIPSLEPGEQASIGLVGDLPIDGHYYYGELFWAVVVDPFFEYDEDSGAVQIGGEVPEDNETNNYFYGRLPVRAPDLIVSDVRFPNGPFLPGDIAIVQVDVKNNGTAPAYGAFSVEFSGTVNGEETIYGLDVGEKVTLEFTMELRQYQNSVVRLDPHSVIGESDEWNNWAYFQDHLTGEIGVTLEADDDEVWTGDVVTLTARFQNTGDLWHPDVYATFRVDGGILEQGRYGGVDENGEIVATLRWTPLQDGLKYGERNFTVQMWPYYWDDDWDNNEAWTNVTVKATPLPLPV